MEKLKILVLIGCRSDEGLSAPIIKRLKADDSFECLVFKFTEPGYFEGSYSEIAGILDETYFDLVFITGDRIEMTAGACACFHNKTKIAHYYGGVINDPICTLDDINRHCISLWSDIQFVESRSALLNLEMLFRIIKKKPNAFLVGITHMEDLEIDESLVPKHKYDLVLYNPITMYEEHIGVDIHRNTIWIGPNPDLEPQHNKFTYKNLPRPQFLGLLKNCKQFITNSSAGIYEAPYFLKPDQIVLIGDRNKNRQADFYKGDSNPLYHKTASELILEHLKKWWKDTE